MAIKFIINRKILRFFLPSLIVLSVVLINIILFWPQNDISISEKIFINAGSTLTKVSKLLAQKRLLLTQTHLFGQQN